VAADVKGYQDTVSRFIDDPQARLRLGARVRESIINVHTGEGWKQSLERLYTRATELGPNTGPLSVEQERGATVEDIALSWMHARTEFSTTLEKMLEWYCKLLPLETRLKVWWKMCRDRRTLLPGALVSEFASQQVKNLFRGQSHAPSSTRAAE
jgi:hypothetical protein